MMRFFALDHEGFKLIFRVFLASRFPGVLHPHCRLIHLAQQAMLERFLAGGKHGLDPFSSESVPYSTGLAGTSSATTQGISRSGFWLEWAASSITDWRMPVIESSPQDPYTRENFQPVIDAFASVNLAINTHPRSALGFAKNLVKVLPTIKLLAILSFDRLVIGCIFHRFQADSSKAMDKNFVMMKEKVSY
ncbi:hypothetical protein K470DRAFT_266016 [Piedraia hortae CBS 480.64]|uniref:Uncharacterized protein n=1 Tax=Piedraia hortae CBS 480.64 TaxID=1314780 RepID=A0A6A7BT73_9PEZI|nr:hypothetical protein K470DRAFT_266016 [Piedraia hortae CBS 480.64]